MRSSPHFIILLLFSLGLITLGCASSAKVLETLPVGLNTYKFQQLDSLIKQDARPVAIFIHAPWCQYCRNMEQTTLSNSDVIAILNEEFYYISLDGEQRETINFRNYNFEYKPKGRNSGTHQLARYLGTMDSQLTYPSFVILDTKLDIVFQHNAFIMSDRMIAVLQQALKSH